MKNPKRKYRIKEILESKSLIEYKYLKEEIPKKLGVAYTTFWYWMHIEQDSKKDIGYGHLKDIATLLGVEISELEN